MAPGSCNLAVIWSAGDASFHSSDREVAEEQTIFTESVGVVQNLRELVKPTRFGFHFISSAGGLFEGQRAVDFNSAPAPLRPYGRLKLAQEEALSSSFDSGELACYRPSSVYGPMVALPAEARHPIHTKKKGNNASRAGLVSPLMPQSRP